MGTELMRINKELANQLREIARKNEMKITEASREAARELKKKNGKSTFKEIKF